MKFLIIPLLCLMFLAACTPNSLSLEEASVSAANEIEVLTVTMSGNGTNLAEANSGSERPAISANGQRVTFVSNASNLVNNDTNFFCGLSGSENCADIFLFNLAGNVLSRVSKSSAGIEGNNWSDSPAISDDGRFIAYISAADNLVPNDTNGVPDVFQYDTQTGQTKRISISSSGTQSNGASAFTSLSNNGRYVAFVSSANNLVPNDTNGLPDIFIHDTQTGATSRVSVSSTGQEANNSSLQPTISADGRFVTFVSDASNLVASDNNNFSDVFVHDTQTGGTSRVSTASNGTEGNNISWAPDISGDGRYIVFGSEANNLTATDTNIWGDIFLHDRMNNTTTLISTTANGGPANSWSQFPVISSNGSYLAFFSWASNLTVNDKNSWPDIFLYKRATSTFTLISAATDGTQELLGVTGTMADISSNGQYIVFTTPVSNLVPNDTNGEKDVFVYDRQTTTIIRVSGN